MAEELVEVQQDAGVVIVSPHGDVDMSRSPQLRSALREALESKGSLLIVSLCDVGYMDSSGLATLVEAMRTAKRQGTRMILCGMNPKVKAIFEIARLDQFFVIFDDLDEARKA